MWLSIPDNIHACTCNQICKLSIKCSVQAIGKNSELNEHKRE